MAILNLAYGQEKVLKDLICRDNPELLEFPESFFYPLGDVIDNQNGTVTVLLTGNPGAEEQIQITGKLPVTYRRLDIDTFLKNIPQDLYLTNPTSVHRILPQLNEQFGIALNPDDVHDDALSGEATGVAVIRFKAGPGKAFVLPDTIAVAWELAPYTHLRDVFTVADLNGFVPPVLPPLS